MSQRQVFNATLQTNRQETEQDHESSHGSMLQLEFGHKIVSIKINRHKLVHDPEQVLFYFQRGLVARLIRVTVRAHNWQVGKNRQIEASLKINSINIMNDF
jgi:hypothetical protein